MKNFTTTKQAVNWIDESEGRANVNERVHGALSFIAGGERFTCGFGLIARSEDWNKRKGGR